MIKGGVVTHLQFESWYSKYFKTKNFEIHQMQREAFGVLLVPREHHEEVRFSSNEGAASSYTSRLQRHPKQKSHSDLLPPFSLKKAIL